MNEKCPKCGKVTVTMSSYLSSWITDQEPYEADKFEEQREINEDLYINAQYCEECGDYTGIWFEPELDNQLTIQELRDQFEQETEIPKEIYWDSEDYMYYDEDSDLKQMLDEIRVRWYGWKCCARANNILKGK